MPALNVGRDRAYILPMRRLAAATLVITLAAPVSAQEADPGGFNLMKEGARLLFRGLLQEMEPAMSDLQGMAEELRPKFRDFAQEMGPALGDLIAEVEDWSVYEPPEMLPNGDIILRRKPVEPDDPEGATPRKDQAPPNEGEIDL